MSYTKRRSFDLHNSDVIPRLLNQHHEAWVRRPANGAMQLCSYTIISIIIADLSTSHKDQDHNTATRTSRHFHPGQIRISCAVRYLAVVALLRRSGHRRPQPRPETCGQAQGASIRVHQGARAKHLKKHHRTSTL